MSSAATYQAGPIKRKRRTKAQVEQLENQIVDVLREDHPQSIRHVFYRMTNPRLPEPVEKSERGYQHVQHRCTELRREGRLPFGWISDATRRGHFTNTYLDAGDFIRSMSGLYRQDIWKDAPTCCEVWAESRSIAGVIQNVCREMAVDLYPAGGFSSITFAHEAAEGINAFHDNREVFVFYIGDYDPAGVLIDRSLESELRSHLNPEVEMHFERIGITEAQIDDYDLPTKPRKKSDKRALHIKETVEAEAMPADTLRSLLRARVEDLLPGNALHVAKVAEEHERRMLRRMAMIAEDL